MTGGPAADVTGSVGNHTPQDMDATGGGCFDDTAKPVDYGAEGGMALNVHGGGAHTGVVPPGFEGIDSHVLDAAPRARLSPEERLQREVARRRQQDLERRARIFDAKVRTIGIDKETLDRQVAEKAARKKEEAERARIEDRQFLGVNRTLHVQEKERSQARFEAEKAAKEFSMNYLNFQSRDVFDLNDPKAITKAPPTRLHDTDERLGPASLQRFNGEDLHKGERDRQQKMQIASTLEQQVFEKKMIHKMHEGEDDLYRAQAQDVIEARNEMEAQETGLRNAIMSQYQADLLAAIEGRAAAQSAEQEANQRENQRELDFHGSDPFLQENRPHIMPNGKALPGQYKGSTRDERIEVFGQQLEQCAENSMKKMQEGMDDKNHHNQTESTRKTLVMMEREKQRMRRAMAMEVANHNRAMLQKQKDSLAEAGPDGHKNKIHPDFFEQFGVGTR